jgi:hypothetical protein
MFEEELANTSMGSPSMRILWWRKDRLILPQTTFNYNIILEEGLVYPYLGSPLMRILRWKKDLPSLPRPLSIMILF